MSDKVYSHKAVKDAMKLMFQRGVYWLENHNPDTDDGWGSIIDKVIADCMPDPTIPPPTPGKCTNCASEIATLIRCEYCGHPNEVGAPVVVTDEITFKAELFRDLYDCFGFISPEACDKITDTTYEILKRRGYLSALSKEVEP